MIPVTVLCPNDVTYSSLWTTEHWEHISKVFNASLKLYQTNMKNALENQSDDVYMVYLQLYSRKL